MAIVRCNADEHYYEDEKHTFCPYCTPSDGGKTKVMRESPLVENEVEKEAKKEKENAPKTEFAWGRKKRVDVEITPVVGWLVVVNGAFRGKDFRLTPAMNNIGRDETNEICVDFDSTISRVKHTTIIYDYKNALFFIQHGEGNNLTYLNETIVLQPIQLAKGDIITLGNTDFEFMPFCDDNCRWEL